ncbi:MAG: orotidine-5'-phosphate decarboxylase [Thermoanaerobaculia bacterium]
MKPSDRLIVALDRSNRLEILDIVDELSGLAGLFKIGLQSFVANGPSLVREISDRGERVFLDLKLHDIPNTVRKSVEEAARLGAAMLTIHASGGEEMIRAASDAARSSGGSLMILGVTVLTSLDGQSLERIGMRDGAEAAVIRLAHLAMDGGAGGVVASPREIVAIRRACGESLKIITPGIRTASEAAGDQARTLSAREAVEAGADYIVVGRPIIDAPNRREAAVSLIASISRPSS